MTKFIELDASTGGKVDTTTTAKYPKARSLVRRGLARASVRFPVRLIRDNRSTTTAMGVMLLAENSEAVRADLVNSNRRARRLKGLFLREVTTNG